MYISGTRHDFEVRLHQFPLSGLDLTMFKIESSGYQTGVFPYASGELLKWNKEFDKKSWQLLNSGQTIIY